MPSERNLLAVAAVYSHGPRGSMRNLDPKFVHLYRMPNGQHYCESK